MSCVDTRRRELVGNAYETEAAQAFFKTCQHQEYNIAVYADTHIYLVLEPIVTITTISAPGDEMESPFCDETLLFHDGMDDGKVIRFEESGHKADRSDEDMFHFEGTFHLLRLITALKKAVSIQDVAAQWEYEEDKYDILHNNCATLILSLLDAMGLEPDQNLATYITNRLASNGGHTTNLLRESKDFQALLPPGTSMDEMEDSQLLHLLVGNYIRNRVEIHEIVMEEGLSYNRHHEETVSQRMSSAFGRVHDDVTYPHALRRYLQVNQTVGDPPSGAATAPDEASVNAPTQEKSDVSKSIGPARYLWVSYCAVALVAALGAMP